MQCQRCTVADDGLLPTAAAQGVDIISRSTCVVVSRDTCQVSNTTLVLITVSLAITLTYFLLLSHFLLRMLRQLRTLTYQAHKINNLLVRLQVNPLLSRPCPCCSLWRHAQAGTPPLLVKPRPCVEVSLISQALKHWLPC